MARVKVKDGPSLEDGSIEPGAPGTRVNKSAAQDPADDVKVVDWLGMARSSYEDTTEYLDANLRRQWERNERAFQSMHPDNSKYRSDLYKGRSKLFRPLTRGALRQSEAGAAASFFSTEDVINISPVDSDNMDQVISASVNHHLMQYRMTTPNKRMAIPWYLTVMGAFQDARKYGFVTSRQWWEYQEAPAVMGTKVDEETGEEVETIDQPAKVLLDRPRIDLIPPENVRVDRSAHWADPINSSPVVICLWPMYVHEVRAKMDSGEYHRVPDSALLQTTDRHLWDGTRTQREGGRQDPKKSETAITDYTTVWVHENFVRHMGRDYVYYTAGVHHMLSDPKPIKEVYYHADDYDRPIVMGYALVETHRTNPSAPIQLTEQLQSEGNETVNLRLDNIKLALNKRYLARRGRKVDLRSLIKNVPGSVTLVDSMDDVDTIEHKDIQGSSFAQEDRINVDFDNVLGNFSPGTVQSNRRMNETVGGMQLLAGAAVSVGEMDLRTFVETWAEPTLTQVMRMVQIYETDEKALMIAASKAKLYERLRTNVVTDEIINQDLMIKVNVGIGATDPAARLEKFQAASEIIEKIFGRSIMRYAKGEEIIKEIMSPLGYRDGARFFDFNGEDPKYAELMAQIEELQKKLDTKELERAAKVDVASIGADGKLRQQQLENTGKIDEIIKRFMGEMEMLRAESTRDRIEQEREIEAETQARREDHAAARGLEMIRSEMRGPSA